MIDRQHQQRQRRGAGQHAAAHAQRADEQPEPEQAVDDRRDRRQVGDVDLDEAGQQAAAAVLLEVDRRGDADRHRQRAVTRMTKMLPASACQMPASLGDARREAGDEIPRQAAGAVAPDIGDERRERPERQAQDEQRERLEEQIEKRRRRCAPEPASSVVVVMRTPRGTARAATR